MVRPLADTAGPGIPRGQRRRRASAGRTSAASTATGQPGFAVTRPLGFDPSSETEILGVATAPPYPGLDGTRQTMLPVAGPPQTMISPPGGAPASISVFPGLGALAGLTFDMPGQSAAFTSAPLTAPVQVTGAPVVRIRVSGAAQVTLFAKVYDVDQAGNATLPFSSPRRCGSPARRPAATSPSGSRRSTTSSRPGTGSAWC